MIEEEFKPMNDLFTSETKSAVKLIKNTKGINWEIKVVKGEEKELWGLMEEAVRIHNELELRFDTTTKEENQKWIKKNYSKNQ